MILPSLHDPNAERTAAALTVASIAISLHPSFGILEPLYLPDGHSTNLLLRESSSRPLESADSIMSMTSNRLPTFASSSFGSMPTASSDPSADTGASDGVLIFSTSDELTFCFRSSWTKRTISNPDHIIVWGGGVFFSVSNTVLRWFRHSMDAVSTSRSDVFLRPFRAASATAVSAQDTGPLYPGTLYLMQMRDMASRCRFSSLTSGRRPLASRIISDSRRSASHEIDGTQSSSVRILRMDSMRASGSGRVIETQMSKRSVICRSMLLTDAPVVATILASDAYDAEIPSLSTIATLSMDDSRISRDVRASIRSMPSMQRKPPSACLNSPSSIRTVPSLIACSISTDPKRRSSLVPIGTSTMGEEPSSERMLRIKEVFPVPALPDTRTHLMCGLTMVQSIAVFAGSLPAMAENDLAPGPGIS